ncbi:MAG: response regulator [Longimicrobiales bacterium]
MAPKRVLIVEDNHDTRTIYSMILRHVGYETAEALHGEEGVRKARERPPDLILMDLSMPVLDGWGANEQLKADPRTASIPVVMVTAHSGLVTPKSAREAGFASLLLKPVETRRLVELVETMIGPPPGATAGPA